MKDNNDFIKNFKKALPYGLMVFLVVFILMCLYFAMRYWSDLSAFSSKIMGILQPVVFGVILAYLINPIVNRFEGLLVRLQSKRTKIVKIKKFNKHISIILAYVVIFALIYLVLKIIIPGVQESIVEIVETFPDKLNAFWNNIDSHIRSNRELESMFQSTIDEVTALVRLKANDITEIFDIASKVFASVKTFVYFILNIIIGLIVSLYVLSEKGKFKTTAKKFLYAIFPTEFSNTVLKVSREVDRIFSGFVIGKIIDSIIIGILCYIAMIILRLPYAVLISVIVGITNIIPFFGPFIGAIPSALILFLTDPKQGIYFVILIIVLQQLDGNVIGPKILGDKTGLSSFWVVFAILISGGLFGFAGMILGVPVFASLYYIVSLTINKRLSNKGLVLDTEEYKDLLRIDKKDTQYNIIYKKRTSESEVSDETDDKQEKTV